MELRRSLPGSHSSSAASTAWRCATRQALRIGDANQVDVRSAGVHRSRPRSVQGSRCFLIHPRSARCPSARTATWAEVQVATAGELQLLVLGLGLHRQVGGPGRPDHANRRLFDEQRDRERRRTIRRTSQRSQLTAAVAAVPVPLGYAAPAFRATSGAEFPSNRHAGVHRRLKTNATPGSPGS